MFAELLFWASLALIVYVYAGYPLLLAILARLFPRPIRKQPVEPSVSLLVAAYNEARSIEAKIENALALDYPPERLEIVIASDGSTDRTADLAQKYDDGKRVRVLAYPHNRGKLLTLNDSVPRLRGDIVAFSDASTMLSPDSLRVLVTNFADARVGAVSGIYKVRKKEHAELGASEDFYWKYETFLKLQEAKLASILGAHGSLYAIRKDLYPFPPPGTINDDYVIPLRILQKGYRVAYETGSVAFEEAHEMGGFSRRIRIMTGNFEQLREMGALLWPLRPLPLLFFLSHKAGRLVVPLAMIAALVSNLLLLNHPTRSGLYAILLALQAAFYLLTICGALWQIRPKILRLPYYFSMINAAAFCGLYFATLGRGRLAWKRK